MKSTDNNNTLLVDYLQRRGVPSSVVNKEVQETLMGKFKQLTEMLSDPVSDFSIVFLYGADSPHKSIFAINILKFFAIQGKSVYFTSASDIDENVAQSAVYVIDGLETVTGYIPIIVKDFIRKKVIAGCRVILTCNTIDGLIKRYSKDFVDFLSHKAVRVDTSVKHNPIIDVQGKSCIDNKEEQCQQEKI